ncbi:MAG: hypothetical protein HUJ31_01495 [Pseudomonadales bacterium]|nr:hypothetical protein [Pseudomonadales bacterium]
MIDCGINPKSEWIANQLDRVGDKKVVAIVTKSGYQSNGACGPDAWDDIFNQRRNLVFLQSASELQKKSFDQIVIPFNGRFCPFIRELFSTYRCRWIHHLHFKTEGRTVPLFDRRPRARTLGQTPLIKPEYKPVEIDALGQWADNDFWNSVKNRFMTDSSPGYEHSIAAKVAARLCYLQSGKAVYLSEDQRYIDVSEMLDRDLAQFTTLARKYPRDLRAGDMLLLRTKGSGDYLIDVADKLLQEAGKLDLRDVSIDWKDALKNALVEKGSTWIGRRLESFGVRLRDPDYIWTWSTNTVMKRHQ